MVKLQCSFDVNAILANKLTLSSPLSIKPDITASERAIKSALLKRCWQLIQAGHDRRQIKFSSNHMYVNGKVFGQITDGEFQRSVNYQLHPPQSLQHKDNIPAPPTAMDQQQLSDVNQSTDVPSQSS